MAQTLYVTFPSGELAEKATGALIDFGVHPEDVGILVDHVDTAHETHNTDQLNYAAKSGISTTTTRDAGAGAAQGATAGLAVGVVAGLAMLTIPGVGIVLGSGTLAAAIGAAVATSAAGAVAGGAAGFLKDQGLPDEVVHRYATHLTAGGAILALTVPSGGVDIATGQEIVAKYCGSDLSVL